jgi:hypothetical protein
MKYKVTNATIKPVRLNSKGQDIRSVRERVGYGIEFVVGEPPNDHRITIQPGQSKILDSLSEGVLKMFRKGEISIVDVKDIGEELKNFTVAKKEPVVEAPATEPLADLQVKASLSGEAGREEDGVNPDGEPNFLAKAPAGGKGLKKSKKPEYTVEEPARGE